MSEHDQIRLGKTLWAIADQLRGAMNADDFRDYMLAFLFLRYLKRLEPLQDKRIVFIFDECHRSQFGENHQAIRKLVSIGRIAKRLYHCRKP